MSAIQFETTLYKIGPWTVLQLPGDASAQLPSRGQVMVEGTLNGYKVRTPLEPDGRWSHWLRIDDALSRNIQAGAGDSVAVAIEPTKDWPEPKLPADFKKALAADTQARTVWDQATPMAHWEWVRWIRSTGREETRKRRVEVGISKLKSGKRRPCCWNRNASSEPSVSKNGVLLEPATARD